MAIINTPARTLGLFRLTMIMVISVDSIRNISISAQYGFALVSFYALIGITFLLPLILISSRLASQYPNTGGSYLWIQAAFGKKIGFLSIWLQWVYQIIWYPTIFAFIASIVATLIHPALELNSWFILLISLSLFWIMTLFSTYGIKATTWISTIGALIGTLLPMVFIIVLAAYWLASKHVSATPLSLKALLPDQNARDNLSYFANILFSVLGLEVAAMHAGDVKTPERTYRKAMMLAGMIILVSLIFSALALSIVIPPAHIGLLDGLMAAFSVFLDAYHLGALIPFVGLAIILGSLGIAFSWIIGLARGLQVACVDAGVFPSLQALNKRYMPYRVLLLQGVIYSLLVSVFLLFPNVNNAYWILSALTSQFALIYYVILFMAAIKLVGNCKQNKTPGSSKTLINFGLLILAIITSVIGIGVGFIPPTSIPGNSLWKFELLLIAGLVLFCLPVIFICKRIQNH